MGALEFEKKFHLLKLKVLPLKTKIVYDTYLNSLFAAAMLGYYTILHMLFIGLPSKNVKMRQLKNYEDKNSAINLGKVHSLYVVLPKYLALHKLGI